MNIPIFLDAYHRRDYDALIEKLWRAKVWIREMNAKRRIAPVPALIEKQRKRA